LLSECQQARPDPFDAIPWSEEKKKKNKRISTRSFLEHLNPDNHRRAFDLVTSKASSAWKN